MAIGAGERILGASRLTRNESLRFLQAQEAVRPCGGPRGIRRHFEISSRDRLYISRGLRFQSPMQDPLCLRDSQSSEANGYQELVPANNRAIPEEQHEDQS